MATDPAQQQMSMEPIMVDTGSHFLVVSSFESLQQLQPDITVINESDPSCLVSKTACDNCPPRDNGNRGCVTEPFGHIAKWVKGTISIAAANGEVLTLEDVVFYACADEQPSWIPTTCKGNFGISNGYNSRSPLMNRPSVVGNYITFDYKNSQMLLQPTYNCPSWMGIDDRAGMIWPFVFIDEFYVDGVKTDWALGKGGPKQYNNNVGTMGMLDTGGGVIHLATESIDKNAGQPPQDWNIPAPQSPQYGECPDGRNWKFIHDNGCTCYYGDIELTLEGAGALDSTKDIRVTHDDVVGLYPKETEVPTWVSCPMVPGTGNYANLGGVIFNLHKITFGINAPEVCIEDYAVPSGDLPPPPPVLPVPGDSCVDANDQCAGWAAESPSQCDINPEYMLESCALSCQSHVADDEDANCHDWAFNRNQCAENSAYMLESCATSCFTFKNCFQ